MTRATLITAIAAFGFVACTVENDFKQDPNSDAPTETTDETTPNGGDGGSDDWTPGQDTATVPTDGGGTDGGSDGGSDGASDGGSDGASDGGSDNGNPTDSVSDGGSDNGNPSDADADADSDADADADADADSDTDADTDSDTDADTGTLTIPTQPDTSLTDDEICQNATALAGYLDPWQTPNDGRVYYCHSGSGSNWTFVESDISSCLPHLNHGYDVFPTTGCDS